MSPKITKKERRVSWHTDKRLMVGLLIVVIPTLFISIWNTSFLLRTLDTSPSIVERIIALEYSDSAQGEVNKQILNTLELIRKESKEDRAEVKKTRDEQLKRTSAINFIQKKMGAR